jgi:long-chain-fatty-acid--CoA ligase ACSBG
MMSHDNVIFNLKNVIEQYKISHTDPEVTVSYLPLSHIAGSVIDVFLTISIAATVYFADKKALKGTLINTLLAARPTFFFGVPRVYEKFHEKMSHAIEGTRGLSKFLATWATNTAMNYHLNNFYGKSTSTISYLVAKRLVLNKIKAKVGLERCKFTMVGAAPFNVDTLKFFLGLDLPIFELYGMTENGLTFATHSEAFRLGSVGKCVINTEAKILNPNEDGVGEICTRGRNSFMGYVYNIEKTRETIDDELWLHTGDVGYIDKNGFLYLTGRIKELIITAGGENIPFLNIENAVVAECSAISNAFLIGDKRKFLTMLISLKTEVDSNGVPQDELAEDTLHHMTELGLNYKLISEILDAGPDEKVLNLIQGAIDRANAKAISNAQRVQKFMILPNDFSMHTGELGPTMKLKRGFVLQKYKKEIDEFYN